MEIKSKVVHTGASLALIGEFARFQIGTVTYPAAHKITLMNLNLGFVLLHGLGVSWHSPEGTVLEVDDDLYRQLAPGESVTLLSQQVINRLAANGEAMHPKRRGLASAHLLAMTVNVDAVTPHGDHRLSVALRLHWATDEELWFLDDPELPTPTTTPLGR